MLFTPPGMLFPEPLFSSRSCRPSQATCLNFSSPFCLSGLLSFFLSAMLRDPRPGLELMPCSEKCRVLPIAGPPGFLAIFIVLSSGLLPTDLLISVWLLLLAARAIRWGCHSVLSLWAQAPRTRPCAQQFSSSMLLSSLHPLCFP